MAEYDKFLDLPEEPTEEAQETPEQIPDEMVFCVSSMDDELPPIGQAETPAEPVKPEPADDPIEALRKLVKKKADDTSDEIRQWTDNRYLDDRQDRTFRRLMEEARAGKRFSREMQAVLYSYYKTRTVELYLSGEMDHGSSYSSYVKYIMDYIPAAEMKAYFQTPWGWRALHTKTALCDLIEWLGYRYSQDPAIKAAADERLAAKRKSVMPFGMPGDEKGGIDLIRKAMAAEKEKVKEGGAI